MQSVSAARRKRAFIVFLSLLLAALGLAPRCAAVPDFSFIQVSDLHFPHSGSEATLADLAGIGEVYLRPYRTVSAKPSFIIETGDLTEFGPRGSAWDRHNRAISALGLPCYSALGNHDTTWRSLTREISETYGSTCYSWNDYGCHFVVLRSACIQDPRPVLEPQQLSWLKRDLEQIDKDTPVFVAFHHPLDTKEFSSPRETAGLVEILRPYNIAAILVGHSHSIVRTRFAGFDMIRGGSAWGPYAAGCAVYSVKDDVLRVAYRIRGNKEAAVPLLQKPLRGSAPRPSLLEIISPAAGSVVGDALSVQMRLTCGPGIVERVEAAIDGSLPVELTPGSDGTFNGIAEISKLPAGEHYLAVTLAAATGQTDTAYRQFTIARDKLSARWKADMGAASKSTPAVSENLVYVGANDGWLRAYDRSGGALVWRFFTRGPVICEPLLLEDRLYFGSEDGNLYCVTADRGYLVWKHATGSPVYSSPVTDGRSVFVGCCSGAFYSLDAQTGNLNWTNTDAGYTIESKPFVAGGRVYYGAWDCYVYCVDTSTGKLVWKCMGQGSAEGKAPEYYSPADCGPVVCGGKVFVADRKFRLSIIDAGSGVVEKFIDGVSAVSLSADGCHVYARRLDGRLDKLDCAGTQVWSVMCGLDDVPAAPAESDGTVYACSKRGLVSAVSATDGRVLWQYQATTQSYVLSSVAGFRGTAFVSGMDGSLTAVCEPGTMRPIKPPM